MKVSGIDSAHAPIDSVYNNVGNTHTLSAQLPGAD